MRGGKARRPADAGPRRFRSLDSTGNVRVLTPDDLKERPRPGDAQFPGRLNLALPMASYDGLSLPALRSRIRSLDAAQLRVLLEYERSNGRRDAVMAMFERRIMQLGVASRDAT